MPYALCLMPYALCLTPYALRFTPYALRLKLLNVVKLVTLLYEI